MYEEIKAGSKYKYEISNDVKEIIDIVKKQSTPVKEKPDWRGLINKYSKK